MSNPCSTHPDRDSTGSCVRCGNRTCALCALDVDGTLFCSVLCFTEQALASKGKTLRQKRPDPLAAIDFQKQEALEEPSVVLGPEDAGTPDDSSVMMTAAESEDRSETSILDMSSPKTSGRLEESSVAPLEGRLKDHTSILGMGAWMEPPQSETPLPMVLPGTRRSTILSACVFHPDTPAVVVCSRCSDAICTMCITEEEQGGRCSPSCRRDLRRVRRNRALMVLGGVGTAVVLLWVVYSSVAGGPKPDPGAVAAAAARAKTDAQARAKEAEQLKLEAAAREEARLRVEARAKEEATKAEAAARAKADAESRAKAEADAKEAALKAEAEAKAAAIARAEAVAKAEADAKEALAKAEARAAAEAAAKAAKERAEAEARAKAEAEARAKAAAELRAKEEARAAAEAKAKAAALEKAKEEAAAKGLAVEKSLRKASGLIREATPAFCALADQAVSEEDGPAVLARIDSVASQLSAARSEYATLLDGSESRDILERRIAIIGDLLAALRVYRARFAEQR